MMQTFNVALEQSSACQKGTFDSLAYIVLGA